MKKKFLALTLVAVMMFSLALAVVADTPSRPYPEGNFGPASNETSHEYSIINALKFQPKFIQVSAGYGHTVAIADDGRLWAWGDNYSGKLGDGTNTSIKTPKQINTSRKFTQVSAGYSFTVAIDDGGNLWTWGWNGGGQLGDGTNEAKNAPVQIAPGRKFVQISAGTAHTVAIDSGGNLWTWGMNNFGQLGDGTNTDRNEPVQIQPGVKFIQVAAGSDQTLAIADDNRLWTWGRNDYGQLGDGTNTDRTKPVRIMPDVKFTQVAAGDYHTVAIDGDDSLWTWGANSEGQLGDGTNTERNVPAQIPIKTKFIQISAGWGHTVAITDENDNLWAWGANHHGQMAYGMNESVNTPTHISTKMKFTQLSAGAFYTMGINDGGALWAWGDNFYGQLGDGTTISRDFPVRIKVSIFTIVKPIIISFEQISFSDVIFTADAADVNLYSLQGVTLGDRALRENVDFEISEGELALKAEYLETLEPGTHTFTLEFGDGENATIELTIAEAAEETDTTEEPETTTEAAEPTTEPPTEEEEEESAPLPPKPFSFTDVPESEWYYNDVKIAYESGLISGKSDTSFAPGDNLTYAEAVKLAACMHQLYTEGKVTLAPGAGEWYDAYVAYAKTNGIISKDYAWNTPATRAGYMEIFASALPDDALAAINTVPGGSIPDVPMTHAQAGAIYKLYRAGILQGVDPATHECNPASNIRRSEVAAILTRMMNPEKRVEFTMV